MGTFKIIWTLLLLFFLESAFGTFKRVCYYTNWSQYRAGIGRFLPSDIDPFLCTHIIFSFGKLVGNEVQKFETNDFELYKQLNSLKQQNPELKTLLALGGWNAGSVVYSQMVSTAISRSQFIESAIEYLKVHNFDGLDMDWEYPANRGGAPEDKVNFGLLAKELMAAFEAESQSTGTTRLLLTAAVAAGKNTIDIAYDVPSLATHMDFINLMSYDLHGSWDSTTGHNSPLFPRTDEYWSQRYLNIEYSANYWHTLGLPKDKLVIGLATYGRSFTLSSSGQTGIGAAAIGPGARGTYTQEAGFLSYYEICAFQASGKGSTTYDFEQKVPYYTDGSLWVGFDDEISIAIKVQWIVEQGYGGAMIWALDLDDFKKTCSQSSRNFPLMNIIKDSLVAADNGQTLTTPVIPTGVVTLPTVATSSASSVPTGGSTLPSSDPPNFTCVGMNNGLYPDINQCSRYFQCHNGISYHMRCPSSLVFNAETKVCDYQSNVNCDRTLTTTTPATSTVSVSSTSTTATLPVTLTATPSAATSQSTSASSTKTTSTSVLSPEEFCREKPIDLYGDPSDCSKYFNCFGQGAVLMSCPAGLFWHHTLKICDWLRNVDCSRTTVLPLSTSVLPLTTTVLPPSTTTVNTPSTTAVKNPSTPSSLPLDFCSSKGDGNHKHPTDCSKFVTCLNNTPYVRTCPAGLRWNQAGYCDWKENVPCDD